MQPGWRKRVGVTEPDGNHPMQMQSAQIHVQPATTTGCAHLGSVTISLPSGEPKTLVKGKWPVTVSGVSSFQG